jgi:hypothetical protein
MGNRLSVWIVTVMMIGCHGQDDPPPPIQTVTAAAITTPQASTSARVGCAGLPPEGFYDPDNAPVASDCVRVTEANAADAEGECHGERTRIMMRRDGSGGMILYRCPLAKR